MATSVISYANEALTVDSLDVLLKGSLDVLLNGLDLEPEPEGVELSRDRKGQSGTCCSAICIKEIATLIFLRCDSAEFVWQVAQVSIKDDFKKSLFCVKQMKIVWKEWERYALAKYGKGFTILGYLNNFFPSVTSTHRPNNTHGRFMITKAQQNHLVLDEPKKYLWSKTIAAIGTCNIRASCRGVGLVPRLFTRGRWRFLVTSCSSSATK